MGMSAVGPTVKPKWFHGEMTSIASTSTANWSTDKDPSLEVTLLYSTPARGQSDSLSPIGTM